MSCLVQHIFIFLTYFMPNYFMFKKKHDYNQMAGWVQSTDYSPKRNVRLRDKSNETLVNHELR